MRHAIQPLLAALALFAFAPLSHATVIQYTASLNGPAESPPNGSPGSGTALVTVDDSLNTMRVQVSFADLLGTTTAAHIHCCTAVPLSGTAGVATPLPSFPFFPLGVTSGSYDRTFDMTLDASYNPAFVSANGGTAAGAEAALLSGLSLGEAYFNIHSSVYPGGEIRGFMTAPRAVPEPATWTVFLLGLGGLALGRSKASSWRFSLVGRARGGQNQDF